MILDFQNRLPGTANRNRQQSRQTESCVVSQQILDGFTPNLLRVLGTLFWGCRKFLLGHLTCLATPLLLAAIFYYYYHYYFTDTAPTSAHHVGVKTWEKISTGRTVSEACDVENNLSFLSHRLSHTHTHNKQCWFSWHFGKDRCYLKLNSLFGSIVTISLCSATLCVFSAFHLHFGVKKCMQGLKGKVFISPLQPLLPCRLALPAYPPFSR